MPSEKIAVLVVDDHPAVRAGLRALFEAEADMHVVGGACDEFTLVPAVRRFGPDVVLLDYQMPGTNGIALCQRLKSGIQAPRVVIYSSFISPSMAVPARIAGADALVDKAVPPRELAATVRRVAAGDAAVVEVTPEAMVLAADLLEIDDLPILEMLTAGAAPRAIAEAVGISLEALSERTARMLEVLAPGGVAAS